MDTANLQLADTADFNFQSEGDDVNLHLAFSNKMSESCQGKIAFLTGPQQEVDDGISNLNAAIGHEKSTAAMVACDFSPHMQMSEHNNSEKESNCPRILIQSETPCPPNVCDSNGNVICSNTSAPVSFQWGFICVLIKLISYGIILVKLLYSCKLPFIYLTMECYFCSPRRFLLVVNFLSIFLNSE